MVTHDAVHAVVSNSGIWAGEQRKTHAFLLSPDVYEITSAERDALEQLGGAINACLSGISYMYAVSLDPKQAKGRTWGMIGRALRTGMPKYYRDLAFLQSKRPPDICKVDFMRTPDGRHMIAEIDGHNKHGLGYSVLAARMRRAVSQNGTAFPGVAHALAEAVWSPSLTDVRSRLAWHNGVVYKEGEPTDPEFWAKPLVLLYADQERFYLPECLILRDELRTLGVNLTVVAESDVKVAGNAIKIPGLNAAPKLFVDFPFMFHNTALVSTLSERYRAGTIDFLIPPKPFLGAKVVLALLRNDEREPELEAILAEHIPGEHLDAVRKAIPVTLLLHKRFKNGALAESGARYVLKESVSSGMKGTLFADDPDFLDVFERAKTSNYQYVFQEEVRNQEMPFRHFNGTGEPIRGTWYMRVTAHYTAAGVADIVVTATRDKRVHGGNQCIMLGTTIGN